MITDNIYFTQKTYPIIQQIENEMDDAIIAEKFLFRSFTREEMYNVYCSIFYEFPYRIIPKNDFIGISINALEVLDGGSSFDEHQDKNKLYDFQIQEFFERRKSFDPKNCLETVEFFIDEYFIKLVFQFDKFIESAKTFPSFLGINDEQIILLNLIKHYRSTLSNESIQIDFFWAIQLPKKINDQLILLLIEYLEQRVAILNIKTKDIIFENKNSVFPEFQNKIIWNGNQQQLCELFLKLKENKWVEDFEEGNLKLFVSSLCNLFDIKKTKKKDTSDEITSLYQIFKGEIIDGKKTYPFLEKPRYKKVIKEINKN
ncbi:hypothetical protein [Chryseobacterium sp. Leaf201]|uniref:hypothetical protein n=1 Tax=Chryseobacterium sp. Leaf201 TaxID=1735672 RepID=UPI0006FE8F7C|nr:hypothetical protein [Chryseobacterium sp. Leaf201]KQM50103.1 hypothetical protein ASE55_09530 [Chryseobacterium sp. Leaf201]